MLWSETITEVKMMSMKVPSNEEIKKWNVDQVQEFLAQVDTLINKHLFKNVRGKHILQQNLTIFSLHDYTYRPESESCGTLDLERLEILRLAWLETVIYDDNK